MKPQEQAALDFLESNGASSAADICRALSISQPTASRLLKAIEDEIFTLGAGKLTRYAVGKSIGSWPASQPIWRIDETGAASQIGSLNFLARQQIHLGGQGVSTIFEPSRLNPLPWLISGLRAQGFLGRIHAKQLGAMGLGDNPENWDTESILISAIHTYDAPGALLMGASASAKPNAATLIPSSDPSDVLDRLSHDVASTLPAGSSAAGEQPKFLAHNDKGESFVVKFSANRGTPHGDRWSDLLIAEALASEVLNDLGITSAHNEVLHTDTRTYLLCPRFDRIASGRRHAVSLGAVHDAFIKSSYVNWFSSCNELARQGRLGPDEALTVHDIFRFGQLIGNTDMHSGNSALFVHGDSLQEMLEGKFSIAPVYDMLPMRWRPDPSLGMQDYAQFDADYSMAPLHIRQAAKDFWLRLASHPRVSNELAMVAAKMSNQMGAVSQERPARKDAPRG